jgi:hypothetical protein
MARREYTESHRHFNFPFSLRLPKQLPTSCLPPMKSPVSSVDMITRSVQTMKRFFSTSSKEPFSDETRKRPRLRKSAIATEPSGSARARRTSGADFFVSPERSRRNGIVFDDITFLACNVDLARSNTIPSRRAAALNLADIDYTQPPPEWIRTALLQTNYVGQESTMRTSTPQVLPAMLEPAAPDCHVPTSQVIDFLTFTEFYAIKDTTSISLSALPSQPGFLRDTLFKQISTALNAILERAKTGLETAWNTSTLVAPLHFVDSIVFVADSCNNLSITLTEESVQPGDVSEISRIYGEITRVAVQTARVLDALDLRNLVSLPMRLNCSKRLTRTVDKLITAARGVPHSVVNTLESIAGFLDINVPVGLLKCRFGVHHALMDFLLRASCLRLVHEDIPLTWSLDQWTSEKLGRYILVLKKVSKQLDRIGMGDIMIVKSPQRENILKMNDLKLDMLKMFSDAVSQRDLKEKFHSLRTTIEFAKLAGERTVEAESFFCMAHLIISKGNSDTAMATSLLLEARSLNSSGSFQTKVQVLLTTLRRRTISSLLNMAAEVNAQESRLEFESALRAFIRILLARYPAEGVDVKSVMDGDLVKGLLRIVRVFHPDKNRSAGEERRWICEEITKVKLLHL